MCDHHVCVVGRSGGWLCAVDFDWLPGYVAVAGAFVEMHAFNVLFLSEGVSSMDHGEAFTFAAVHRVKSAAQRALPML